MHKKADEVREELVNKLGLEFGSVLHDLEQEYVSVKIVWRFYRSFFGTNPERIDLLNKVSGLYFYTLENIKFEAVLLGICRITDPIQTGHGKGAKQNLTVRRLGAFLKEEHKAEWESLLKAIDEKVGFAREWRNQKIAHSSFDVKNGKARLEDASRQKVEEALKSIENAINFIQKEYLNSEQMFDPILPMEDEIRVLEMIHDGLSVKNKEQDELEEAIASRQVARYRPPEPKPEWLTKRPK